MMKTAIWELLSSRMEYQWEVCNLTMTLLLRLVQLIHQAWRTWQDVEAVDRNHKVEMNARINIRRHSRVQRSIECSRSKNRIHISKQSAAVFSEMSRYDTYRIRKGNRVRANGTGWLHWTCQYPSHNGPARFQGPAHFSAARLLPAALRCRTPNCFVVLSLPLSLPPLTRPLRRQLPSLRQQLYLCIEEWTKVTAFSSFFKL